MGVAVCAWAVCVCVAERKKKRVEEAQGDAGGRVGDACGCVAGM